MYSFFRIKPHAIARRNIKSCIKVINRLGSNICPKLRSRGIYSVEKVKNCIFEQNGQLTVIENDEDNIRFPIISDGQINDDVLDLIHKSSAWLEQEVAKAGYNSIDDVFLGEYIKGQLRLVGYSEK